MTSGRTLIAFATSALLFLGCAQPAPAKGLSALGPGAFGKAAASQPLYKLPFPAGTTLTVCQGHGTGTHTGNGEYAWDFCMPIGTHVLAARAGTVRAVVQGFDGAGWGPAFANRNNYVIVDHGDGTSALYMHLQHDGVRVNVGQKVQAGQFLAYSGNTGWTSAPHTHFMIMRTDPVDWYAPSIPAAFADVPGNGVPTTAQRVTSGNTQPQSPIVAAVCKLSQTLRLPGFVPGWVQAFAPASSWSGNGASAVRFGPVWPGQRFLVTAPQAGPRLAVQAATGGAAFVPATDVGPSGPPPVCQR